MIKFFFMLICIFEANLIKWMKYICGYSQCFQKLITRYFSGGYILKIYTNTKESI